MTADWLRAGADGGSELTLHVQPGAARSGLAGRHGDALKLRIRAAAVEGAANAALVRFLADRLERPQRAIRLLRGETTRRKTVWVDLPPAEVARRLGEADTDG